MHLSNLCGLRTLRGFGILGRCSRQHALRPRDGRRGHDHPADHCRVFVLPAPVHQRAGAQRDQRIAMREKIVLIGAGSAMFTRGLVADLIHAGLEADLALVDIDPEALEVAERLTHKMIVARRAPIALSASVDRRSALRGATAVICTVGVGGRRAWEQDVFIPRKYGIFAPVGDTVGPGGTARALRMIPAMVDIARDVLDLAPSALFFNYGNPMAPVCRAIRKATGAPVIGLCHGVFHVASYLAQALA